MIHVLFAFFHYRVFALNSPFQSLADQLKKIRSLGFHCADITDNADGACLGAEFGFTALASLDANPHDPLIRTACDVWQLKSASVTTFL